MRRNELFAAHSLPDIFMCNDHTTCLRMHGLVAARVIRVPVRIDNETHNAVISEVGLPTVAERSRYYSRGVL
jgi:hypothetical protein